MKKSDLCVHDVEFSFVHESTSPMVHKPWKAMNLRIRYGNSINKKAMPASTLATFAEKWHTENDLGEVIVRDDAFFLQFSLPLPFTDAQFTSWLRQVLATIPTFEAELKVSCLPKQSIAMDILDSLDKKIQAEMDERQLIGGELATLLKVAR